MSSPDPTESRSSSTSARTGVVDAIPSRRPAAPEEVTTESAPLWCSRWTFSCSRTAATIEACGASSLAVRAIRTAESSRSTAITTARASAMPASSSTSRADASPATAASPAAVAAARRSASGSMTMMLVACASLAEQGRDRGSSLRAVATDDRVVVQGSPPAGESVGGAGALRQYLQGRADEQDQEEHAGRRDQQRGHEPSAVGLGPDVPVSGRGHGDGRVVEGVDHADLAVDRDPRTRRPGRMSAPRRR